MTELKQRGRPPIYADHHLSKIKIKKIEEAIGEGERSIERLCEIAGLKPSSLYKFCKRKNITLPEDLIPYRFRPDLDELIDRNASLGDMKRELGGSFERFRLYLKQSGQHDAWKKRRNESKGIKRQEKDQQLRNEREIPVSLISLLKGIALKKASEESWHTYQAVDFYIKMSVHSKKTTLNDLVRIFSNYEHMVNSQERKSLEQLSEGTDISAAGVGRILGVQGLPPGYKNRKRHIVSEEQKQVLERAMHIQMSNIDIAVLMGVNHWIVSRYFSAMEKDQRMRMSISPIEGRTNIGYGIASKTYQLKDKGMDNIRITRVMNARKNTVSDCIAYRPVIEPIIMDALRRMYPGKEVTKPYKTWK